VSLRTAKARLRQAQSEWEENLEIQACKLCVKERKESYKEARNEYLKIEQQRLFA
jgi:hypothetical protein